MITTEPKHQIAAWQETQHLATKTNSRARNYKNYRKLIARYKQWLIPVLTGYTNPAQQERQLKLSRK